ncbi:hypothetical protein GCM10011326_05890 [Salipiger profundus]|nr:hypothetical protein GCM10011326_05890 [Salipiger profundus]
MRTGPCARTSVRRPVLRAWTGEQRRAQRGGKDHGDTQKDGPPEGDPSNGLCGAGSDDRPGVGYLTGLSAIAELVPGSVQAFSDEM